MPRRPTIPTLHGELETIPDLSGGSGGGVVTIDMDVVVNFDGISGTITAAKMNTGTHGAAWGTWTTPEGAPNHTTVENHAVTLPFNFRAAGIDYNGSSGQGVTFDFATQPVGADVLHYGLSATVSPCQLMFLARYQTVLDVGSPVSYNCDLWVIAGSNFSVPQRQHTFAGLKFFCAHTSGDLGASIQDDEGWVLVSLFHDVTNSFSRLIVQQVISSGPNWVLGNLLGTSTGTLTAAGDVSYFRFQDYLRPASGTGTIKVKIAGLRNSVLTWPPYNLGTITAPSAVTATQEAIDSVTLEWTSIFDVFLIERKTGSGSYSTLQSAYENNGVGSYTDTTVTETNTYTYRITAVIGNQQSSAVESNPVTIDNTPFEGGDFILAQTLGANDDVNDQRGCKFTVGASPITITELGLWILGPPGQYSATLDVFIYDIDGTSLTSASIPTTGGINQYIFTAIAPLNLSANTSYYLVTQVLAFNTTKSAATLATSVAPAATIDDAVFGEAPTFNLSGVGANHVCGPVNFRWEYT